MKQPSRTALGFLAGCAIGIGAILSLAAQDEPKRAFPRYSVGGTADQILIVDHDENKLHRYTMQIGKDPATDRFISFAQLEGTLDLTQAGVAQVRDLTPDRD